MVITEEEAHVDVADELEKDGTECKAYKVDELPKDVRERVLDKYRYFETEDMDWWKFVYDDWKEKLEELGFMNPDIWFSGFSSQGDGACFDCNHIDIKKFSAHHKEPFVKLFFPKITMHMDAIENCVSFVIKQNSLGNHYSHKNTRDLDWEIHSDVEEYLGPSLATKFEGKVEEIGGLIEDVRMELCDEIYRSL